MNELSKSLSESYNRGDKFLKIEILKNTMNELFITTKKELKIKKNKLFEMIKFWFFPYGGPKNEDTLIKMIDFFQENHSEIERNFEGIAKILQ